MASRHIGPTATSAQIRQERGEDDDDASDSPRDTTSKCNWFPSSAALSLIVEWGSAIEVTTTWERTHNSDDIDTLPPDLQERIGSCDLFFPIAVEACAFQAQLRHHGVVKANKKLPWRHRWPDAVRDDVLARLLALNGERYAEEVALGLRSKSAKGSRASKATAASGNASATGKRRGRPAKAANASDAEQIGLGF